VSHPHADHDHDHDHPELPPPTLEEVGPGVYAYVQLDGSWGLNNSAFVVGRDGVTLVDTCFTERRSRALIEAIGSVASVPVRTLVNTHHHGDHTHGNFLLPGATIFAHELCRDEVLAAGHIAAALFQGVDWGDLEVAAPFVTFDDHLNVWVDDRRLELQFAGPAHTTNDIVAWMPSERILLSGDLVFNGGTPFVVMGSVAGSLGAVTALRSLGARTIVPGHGGVCGPEALDRVEAYLRWVTELAASAKPAGLSPLEAAREADLGGFAELLDSERLVGNLHRAYAELDGAEPGAPIDYLAAFGDMIQFNGGRPLRCLA
jgi:cyclase